MNPEVSASLPAPKAEWEGSVESAKGFLCEYTKERRYLMIMTFAKEDLNVVLDAAACSQKEIYSPPELLPLGWATDVILARAESRSAQAAKKIRELIDESGGSLSCSPAKECLAFQVNLSLVSKQFKKLYQVTMRAYSRRVRMRTAEKLLRESNHLNVDEAARALGYSFTSAFSRCFQRTFGKRPKRYQMQQARSTQLEIADERADKSESLVQI